MYGHKLFDRGVVSVEQRGRRHQADLVLRAVGQLRSGFGDGLGVRRGLRLSGHSAP